MEGLNGADSASVNQVRNRLPASLLEELAEREQTRFIQRKEEAKNFTGSIAPLVLKKMRKKLNALVESTHVVATFKGKDRSKATLILGERKLTRKVDFSGSLATCECLSAKLDEFPCGCMLFAAEKAGKSWSDLLYLHDSVETWKQQYESSVEFNLPGTEQLVSMEPDQFVLPPAAYPIPRGRPSIKRKKGLVEQFKKKLASTKKARGAAAHAGGSSTAMEE